MALVKKINSEWRPSESPDMKIGDVIDMTSADALVDQGMAVYVDEQGNELQKKSATGLKCPTCTFVTDDQYDLASHILVDHPRNKAQAISVPSVFAPVDSTITGTITQGSTQPGGMTVTYTGAGVATTTEVKDETTPSTTQESDVAKQALEVVVEEPKATSETTQKAFKDMTPEEQKAWRMANLAKGREAAKARKEEKRLDA